MIIKNEYFLRMKKYTTYGIISLLVSFISCQKLNENAAGSLVSESFFNTEEDLQSAVTATYYPLVNNPFSSFGSSRVWVPLMGADDFTTLPGGNKENFRDFDRFAGSSLNNDMKYVGWTVPYDVVQAANNVLLNYQKVKGREEFIDQAVAQVRYLRAFAYFWMVRIFGEIPIVTTIEVDYAIKRSPVKDVYDLILEDLQFAVSKLPPSWPGEPGRPTVWAAKSLLAQVYLTMAGWPLKDESKYALAAGEAKDVIDNSGHDLLTAFSDIWLLSNQNNNEIVWAIQFCKADVCGWPYISTQGGSTTSPGEEGGWDDLFMEVGFYKRFPEGPRKEATFHHVFNTGIDYTQSITKHPYLAKYRDGTDDTKPDFIHPFFTNRNLNYLRFAEILLNYAESHSMANGGPDGTDYAAINRVRNRAGLTDLQAGLSQTAFRDSVVAERGWELAGEFSRWFDLVRTEKVEEAAALKDPEDLTPLNPPSHQQYLAPVPYSETLLNPNLK